MRDFEGIKPWCNVWSLRLRNSICNCGPRLQLWCGPLFEVITVASDK